MFLDVLAVKKTKSSFASNGDAKSKKRTFQRLNLIHRSFSSKRISRQFPMISGIHNVVDGALLGVIISVALMSSLALHWRHLWIVAFTKLEITRDLSHRLIDSTAMLERNLLRRKILPLNMVPTKAENLIYLDNPISTKKSSLKNKKTYTLFNDIKYLPIHQGY